VLECVGMCCSVLQCAVVSFCELQWLQCVAVCWSVLECVGVCFNAEALESQIHLCFKKTWRVNTLQCVAVRCSALHCVAVCCSVLQCVAVCFSALQC